MKKTTVKKVVKKLSTKQIKLVKGGNSKNPSGGNSFVEIDNVSMG